MSEYNDKVVAKSTWITKELLEPIVRKIEHDPDVKIQDLEISAAVGAGDNYASILYRTKISYRRSKKEEVEVLNLIIKGPHVNEFMLKMIEETGIFVKEQTFYNKCLPAMKEVQEKYFVEDVNVFAPDSFPCDVDNTIIMEDLNSAGYKMAKRQNQLDYPHACQTVRSLARFHALSLKIKQNEPDWFQVMSKEMFTAERSEFSAMYDNCFVMLGTCVEEWTGDGVLVDVLKKLSQSCFVRACESLKPLPDKLNVLCHGDPWLNNMLYKYDGDGTVQHAKLVDYQICRYSSPVLDLLYFFFSSVKPEVLSTRMFDLVEEYHRHLMNDLRQLDLHQQHGITLEQLKEDMKERSYYCLVILNTLTPIVVSDAKDAYDMDKISEEEIEKMKNSKENPFAQYYKSGGFKSKVLKLLEFVAEIGYLEVALNSYTHLIQTTLSE